MGDSEQNSTPLVLGLLFILLFLLVVLFVLYKKLNREAEGEYTVRRIVYKEGGLRDQARSAALAVGARLGVQLWPGSDEEEEGEEMQEVQDEEEQVDSGGSQESDTEGDEEEEDNDTGNAKEKESNTSNDDSSIGSSEAGEQTKLNDESEPEGETEDKSEEKEEKVGEEQSKAEASGGPGLLIDLKQFSGSAIWSEEGGEGKGDVTALWESEIMNKTEETAKSGFHKHQLHPLNVSPLQIPSISLKK